MLVTLHYVDRVFDWPVGARLYLPKVWAKDRPRRRKARVPEEITFQTKGEIGLDLVDEARAAGLQPRAVIFDAGYGDQPSVLDGLEKRKLAYMAALGSTIRFRLAEEVAADPGDGPPPPYSGQGRPPKAPTMRDRIPVREAGEILASLPPDAWKRVCWREGTKGALVKECTRVRVFRAGRRGKHIPTEGWLLGERPLPGHQGDHKQYFAWGLDDLALDAATELAHVRWVIERFYQDAKGEVGLDDYEGRLWPGLHRHLALVMLAHSFLTLHQSYGPELTQQRAPPEDTGEEKRTQEHAAPPARGFPPGGPAEHRRPAPRGA